MKKRIRTFVAIPLRPSQGLRRICREMQQLGGPIKVVPGSQLHLTLAFLGETPWNRVADVGKVIDEVASRVPEFQLHLNGLSAFPNNRRPRVVWAGVFPSKPVCELAERLSVALEEIGFPREDRPFTPHLTIARVKGRSPESLSVLVDQSEEQFFAEQTVETVHYYQSELTRQGPVYQILSEHQLAECSRPT